MKNMKKVNGRVDVLLDARKEEDFQMFKDEAQARINLGVQVYRVRTERNFSQQELAKRLKTTQRIISDIERAEVNVGIGILSRIIKHLQLTPQSLGEIFGCVELFEHTWDTSGSKTINLPTVGSGRVEVLTNS